MRASTTSSLLFDFTVFTMAASKLSLSVALLLRSISTAPFSNVTSGSSSTSGAWLSGKMNKAGNQ